MTHQQYCIFDDVSTKRVGSLSMATPHWLDERQARAWRVYLKLNQELYAALEVQLQRDSGLSGADYTVLVPLSTASDGVLRTRAGHGDRLGPQSSVPSDQPDGTAGPRRPRGMLGGRAGLDGPPDRRRPVGHRGRRPRGCRDRPSLLLRSPVGGGARRTHCGLRTSPRRDGEIRRVTVTPPDPLDTGVNAVFGLTRSDQRSIPGRSIDR